MRFERLSLRYASNEREALSDITLTVAPGETVALVGASGSGKTSLVNLVPRFYEPTAGRLFIDGHDVTTLTLVEPARADRAWCRRTCCCSTTRSPRTSRYGAMAERSREDDRARRRRRACAGLHPRDAGRASIRWSASTARGSPAASGSGSRSRAPSSRTRRLLILDEATSALDSESERQVQAALDTLMHGRTTIVIAHRLSTIEDADRIVVLDAGRIVEIGTHAALLAANCTYARLHRMQFTQVVPQDAARLPRLRR